MAKKLLTKKRSNWASQRDNVVFKGTTLANSAAIELRYVQSMKKLVNRMTRIAEREIKKLYSTPDAKDYFATDASIASQARILINALSAKFDDMFGEAAQLMSSKMVNQANTASKTALAQSMKELSGGLTVQTHIMSADLHETVKASIAANVQLIKSIPQTYMQRIGGAVLRSVTTGQGLADLMPQIQKYGDMTERKAKNIALDQTRKTYNNINADRMRKVGIQKFEWIHSAGGLHPRQDHIEMSGNIYSFDDLPVIDKNTGERGKPGDAPNCKCTMRPILEFDDMQK